MSDIVLGQFEVTHTTGSAAYQTWLTAQQAGGAVHLLAQRHFPRKGQDFVLSAVGTTTTRGTGVLGQNVQIGKSEIAQDGNGLGNLQTWMNNQLVALTAPVAPTLTLTATGSLTGQGTGYVKVTYVTAKGETQASAEADVAITDDHELSVTSPAAASYATGWNVYIGASAGSEKKQNSTPIAIGTDYTLTGAISTTGVVAPATDGTACKYVQGIDLVPRTDSNAVLAIVTMSN